MLITNPKQITKKFIQSNKILDMKDTFENKCQLNNSIQ